MSDDTGPVAADNINNLPTWARTLVLVGVIPAAFVWMLYFTTTTLSADVRANSEQVKATNDLIKSHESARQSDIKVQIAYLDALCHFMAKNASDTSRCELARQIALSGELNAAAK